MGWLLTSLVSVGISLLVRAPGIIPGAVFGGLCTFIFAVMLLLGATYLSLDADGFTVCPRFENARQPGAKLVFSASRR